MPEGQVKGEGNNIDLQTMVIVQGTAGAKRQEGWPEEVGLLISLMDQILWIGL